MVLNILCRLEWLRIIPSSVFILFAVYHHVVIVGSAFPCASRGVAARRKVLLFDRRGREINIAFYGFKLIRLGHHLSVPDCLRHFLIPRYACYRSSLSSFVSV